MLLSHNVVYPTPRPVAFLWLESWPKHLPCQIPFAKSGKFREPPFNTLCMQLPRMSPPGFGHATTSLAKGYADDKKKGPCLSRHSPPRLPSVAPYSITASQSVQMDAI